MKTINFKHLLCFLVLCLLTNGGLAQNLYVVTASSLYIRSEASGDASVIGKVVKGDTVYVNRVEGYWGQIPCGFRMGYVSMSYIRPIEDSRQEEKQHVTAIEYLAPQEKSTNLQQYVKEQNMETKVSPGFITLIDQNGFEANGTIYRGDAAISYLKNNCTMAYNEYQSNIQKGARLGKVGMGIGFSGVIVGPILGSILYCVGKDAIKEELKKGYSIDQSNVDLMKSGEAFLIIGCTMVGVSIPFTVVGAVKNNHAMENAVEVYNNNYARRSRASQEMELRLNVHLNSVGFALNF